MKNPARATVKWFRDAFTLKYTADSPRITLRLLRQIWEVTVPFWRVPGAWKNGIAVGLRIASSFIESGLRAWAIKIAGDRLDALVHHSPSEFHHALVLYVVAMLLVRFAFDVLSLPYNLLLVRWREFLTRRLLNQYLSALNYYRLSQHPLIDNPDERITEDVKTCITLPTQLFFGMVDSISNAIVFGAVLWHYDRRLIPLCIAVQAVESLIAIVINRPLFRLSFALRRLQGDFRYALLKVRREAEQIAFWRGETAEKDELFERNDRLVHNEVATYLWRGIIDFFEEAIIFLVKLTPVFIAAPLVLTRRTTLGGYTQILNGWNQMDRALGFFADAGRYLPDAAVVARVHALMRYCEAHLEAVPEPVRQIEIEKIDTPEFSADNLTVVIPESQQVLIRNLSFSSTREGKILVIGANGVGKSSLLRCMAGLWRAGEGRISLPRQQEMLFLPQIPHLSLGSLRQQMIYPLLHSNVPDEELRKYLAAVSLPDLEARVGSLSVEQNWSRILSPGEQQRLSFTRVLVHRPKVLFLDEATDALGQEGERDMYELVRGAGCMWLSVAHRASLVNFHDSLLRIRSDGSWLISKIEKGAE